MSVYRKLACILLSTALLLSTVACAGGDGESSAANESASADNLVQSQEAAGSESPQNVPDPVSDPVGYLMSLDEKVTVTWMTWSSEKNVIGRMNQIYEVYPELQDKFELKHVTGGANIREMIQKLRLAVMANADVPDINEGSSSIMPALVSGNMVQDVTDVMQPYLGNLLPAAVEVMSYNNRVYGFPGQVKTKLWYYRKDMFDAAGIDPTAIQGDDDFIAAGHKLQEVYPDAKLWFLGSPSEGFFFEFLLSGNQGTIIDETGQYSIVNNDRVRQIFEFCKRVKDEDIVSTLSLFTPDFEAAIRDSKLASVMTGSWFKDQSYIPTYAPDQEGLWAVATCPPIAGGADRGSESGGSFFCIPNGSQHPEAAMAVLSLLAFDEDVSLGVFTNINAALEPLTDYARANPAFQLHPYYGESLQQAIDSAMEKFDIVGYTPASMVEYNIVTQYFDMYVSGQGELDDLLQKCEDDLRTQIGNPMEFAE